MDHSIGDAAVHDPAVAPDEIEALDPPGDFRGSAAYRREMAAILSRRAVAQLDEA